MLRIFSSKLSPVMGKTQSKGLCYVSSLLFSIPKTVLLVFAWLAQCDFTPKLMGQEWLGPLKSQRFQVRSRAQDSRERECEADSIC